MTTSAAHGTPTPQPAAPAAAGIQVRCLRCNHPNPWDTRFCGQCGTWLGDAKEAALAEAKRLVAAHPDLHQESHDRSVASYFTIFIALGAATIAEIIAISLLQHTHHALAVAALFTFASIKFLLVGAFFMHLKGDKRFYTVFFAVGFFFAAGVLLALQALMRSS